MSNLPPPSSPPPVPPPPPPSGPAGVPGQEQANFGQRFGALLVDGLIFGIPGAVIFFGVLNAVPTELVLCQDDTAICEQPTGTGFGILAVVGLAWFAAILWYIAEFEGNRGATIGRRTVGTKVVRTGTDETIGAGRAVGRYFAKWVSGFPCYLGYFWMLWDKQSQTWHDKIVDSQVVKA